MKRKLLSTRTILVSLLLVSIAGSVLQWRVNQKKNQHVDTDIFQSEIQQQLFKAESRVQNISLLNNLDFQQFIASSDKKEGIAEFYFYKKEFLNFWTSSEYVFNNNDLPDNGKWCYRSTANVHALMRWFQLSDSTAMLALLPLKNAFPYENQYLKNEFNPIFNLPDEVTLSDQPFTNSISITDTQGNHLFWISSGIPVPETIFARQAGFIVFTLAFILYLLLYFHLSFNRGKIQSVKKFTVISSFFFIILLVLSWFDLPAVFFNNSLFSPGHFTVNPLLRTYTHLSVVLFFIVTVIYSSVLQFTFHKKRLIIYILTAIYFGGVVELLMSIIDHSATNFNVYLLNELSFINSWAHLLLFVALAGGYGMLHLSIPRFFRLKFPQAGVYIVVSTILCLGLTHHFNQHKKFTKYQVLAENIRMNGTSVKDPAAELLLEELSVNILSDKRLSELAVYSDSVNALYEHIETKHLLLFKNKYDITVTLVSPNHAVQHDYIHLMQQIGTPVGESEFYSLPASIYESSYAGVIQLQNAEQPMELAILFEFQNKRNFRSYSFPDLLINNLSSSSHHTEISVASYDKLQLSYSDLLYQWPENGKNFQLADNQFARLKLPTGIFYVLKHDYQLVCIRELKEASRIDKVFYFILITAVFLVLGSSLIQLHHLFFSRKRMTIGLTGKFQFVFILLLMISFISTLLFSTDYFRKNYEKEQLQLTNNKKHYIQSSLQETFFWVNDLTSVSKDQLNIILQELAYRFQTDIHVYNHNGDLAGSSISMIFSKQLTSRLIAPEVLFSDETISYRYEKIGQLKYLSGYIELINGDYLPIGYIAIPQFLSQSEINLKISEFLIAVIQIFTIIILLSIILVLIAGNRLATPLRMLEEKLKSMKINGSNARIDYKGTDEIGQLVEQYNKTVDELEKSTQLLIQSEREIAWRTMARQVAHEINNPLTPMKLTIQQMQRLRDQESEHFSEYFNKAAKTLIEQIDNLSRIAGTFSQFARLPETELQVMDVAERLHATVELFKNNAEGVDINYVGEKQGIRINGDPEQFSRVFINLLKNAVQAIPEGRSGKIEVTIRTQNEQVFIDLTDNGTGVSKEAEENIFKPNFTTKTSGMGLGLSISKAIIDHAGGNIRLKSSMETGSVFSIVLPLVR